MKMEVQLRVITLNCWGIPGISSDRQARMIAIATELASGCYDLVALQEVWSYSDYELIAKKIYPVMPYSHYFRSGTIGSGLCVFSKGQIINALFQIWSLNGYAHRIQHGDWFGGKGVGLAQIQYAGLLINFYTAHLHAVYNHMQDEYLSHRVCQAFEFSQFVSLTSFGCDIVIVAGDFNAESLDVPYRLLCHNSILLDAFKQCEKKDDEIGATNETARNSYTPRSILKTNPLGRRIDYILYNYRNGSEVKVLTCSLPLDKVPDTDFSYSDHEAVTASLMVTKSASGKNLETVNKHDRIRVLEDTVTIVRNDMRRVQLDRIFYFLAFTVLFCILFSTVHVQLPYGLQALLGIFRIILSVVMIFCLFMATVWNRMENNALTATQNSAQILLNYLQDENSILLSAGDAPRNVAERI